MQVIKKEDIKDIYYLSPMQEGMLFHHLLEPESSAYLEQFVIRIQSHLDPDLLQKSFEMLIDRYDIFRTAFIYEKVKRPIQTVLKKRPGKIFYSEIGHLTESEQNEWIENFKTADQKKNYDLTKDVLMRISVFKKGKDDYILCWNFHHILMDGWCMTIIMREFIQIYLSLASGESLSLGTVYPYSQYIAWIEKQDKEAAAGYWKSYLKGYTESAGIPEDGGIRGLNGYDQGNVFLNLDEGIARKMEQAAALYHVTVNTLFQTIWGLLIQKYNNIIVIINLICRPLLII